MRVYVASSMKNLEGVRHLGEMLRAIGHTAYVFCDKNEEAFAASMVITKSSMSKDFNAETALRNPIVSNIYGFNMAELKKADCVLLVLPAGRSSHLEAGFAKGQGKSVILYGALQNGEWDAMYGMVDRIFSIERTEAMLKWFQLVREKEVENAVASHHS